MSTRLESKEGGRRVTHRTIKNLQLLTEVIGNDESEGGEQRAEEDSRVGGGGCYGGENSSFRFVVGEKGTRETRRT